MGGERRGGGGGAAPSVAPRPLCRRGRRRESGPRCPARPRRRLVPVLVRAALALSLLVVAALAAVGGVALGGAGLMSVLLAAVVTACIGAGIARDGQPLRPRQAAIDA